jgi:hypothetical protein
MEINTRIGDFGPEGDNGEVSIKAAHDSGVETVDKKGIEPVPLSKGGADIPVKVEYYLMTR